MLDDKKFEEECRFVVAHFKEGAFRTKELFESKVAFRNRRKIAIRWVAASLIAVTLSATAIITYKIRSVVPDEVTTEQCIVDKADNSKAIEIIRLEFNDAKLSDVIKAVEEAYGVKLTNVPDEEIYLTLSYEGNAQDFIDTVNELLNTEIEIER